jgi:hypothetical protein
MSCVVDTNVLVFDTFADSALHAPARQRLDGLEHWYLPGIVLHEYVWALRGLHAALAFAREKVEEWLLAEKAAYSPETPDDILFATREAASYARYNDYLILSQAKRLGLPVLTFDRQLRTEARRQGIRAL